MANREGKYQLKNAADGKEHKARQVQQDKKGRDQSRTRKPEEFKSQHDEREGI